MSMSGKSMFDKLMDAITTIGEYCTKSGQPDTSLEHFYKTEFYNEGWMLKLMLARLLENDLEEGGLDVDINNIRSAAKRGWMSEGRLSAAFTHEQCTHADAVLGDVEVSTTSQWGVELKKGAEQFVVVEAKLGSKLSKGVTNSKEFNQAARNVACMMLALHKLSGDISAKPPACFYVIMPECDENGNKDTQQKLDDAKKTIITEKNKNHELHVSLLPHAQEILAKVSVKALTWEEMFVKLNQDDEKTEKLWEFYNKSLEANGLRKKSSEDAQSICEFLNNRKNTSEAH